jgi:hypothetical protein
MGVFDMSGLLSLAGLLLAEHTRDEGGLLCPHSQARVVAGPVVPEDDPAALGTYRLSLQGERPSVPMPATAR